MKELTIKEKIAFNFIFNKRRVYHRWYDRWFLFSFDYGRLKRVIPRISNWFHWCRELDKEVKISRILICIRDLLLGILRTYISVKTYGGLEFFMTVLAGDLVAPAYGNHHLKEFFEENKNV